jgi:hypothetical protein
MVSNQKPPPSKCVQQQRLVFLHTFTSARIELGRIGLCVKRIIQLIQRHFKPSFVGFARWGSSPSVEFCSPAAAVLGLLGRLNAIKIN